MEFYGIFFGYIIYYKIQVVFLYWISKKSKLYFRYNLFEKTLYE